MLNIFNNKKEVPEMGRNNKKKIKTEAPLKTGEEKPNKSQLVDEIVDHAKRLATGKTRNTFYLEEAAKKLIKLEANKEN